MQPALGCFIVLVYGGAQLIAAWQGIAYHWGWGWSLGAMLLLFGLRFTLPITIGAFFGAKDVWGWHWFFALIFAAPGLLFMVPGVIASLGGDFATGWRRGRAEPLPEWTRETQKEAEGVGRINFCAECGEPVSEIDARFCSSCGKPLVLGPPTG